ncbi:2'-5' RNA ligase family protein [Bacillus manliponensis]|uniref:2'-5' RNA ligase family protein n=1 Tax=Bacillus manliponensis TaxID=574376 RepID=UPI003519133A
MYGVIALFEEEAEKEIAEIWRVLCERGISYYSKEIPSRKPHITIASYENIEVESLIKDMDRFVHSQTSIPITLSAFGTFLGSSTLFLSPIPSNELLTFHQSYHEYFRRYNDNPSSLYLPGKWVPHCTIANHLTEEKFYEAFQHCKEMMKPIETSINQLALIKLEYENNECIDAPILFSKTMTKRMMN